MDNDKKLDEQSQLVYQLKQLENKLIETEKKLKDTQDKYVSVTQQLSKTGNKLIETKQALVEYEEQVEAIHNSGGWKLLMRYYILRDKILPTGSKRRFVLKLGKKFIKKPGVYLRKINLQTLKKVRYYASTEGMSGLFDRVDTFDEKYNDNGASKLNLWKIEEQDFYEPLEFPYFENPDVSIIIPVYNQFAYTYACLKSILENTADISYEVIIADDVSNDRTTEIKEIVHNITVIRNEKNLRFLLNCNNAAKYARGKYIHFLNNDTQVQQEWLNSLVTLIESDSHIGMVGSKLVYPNGKLQEAGGILWKDGSAWNYGNGMNPSNPEYNYVKEADYISGASIMIRKTLWEEIGGFDELFVPAYCEDSDLAFEVRAHGYKVMYQPKSVVVHFEGVSNGTDTTTGLKAYQVENSKKFYEKWKYVLEKDNFKKEKTISDKTLFAARDRSKNKKCILVIDHYVPHFDKDAGSKTVYQYMKLFCEMGYNVKFIGDNFYRHEPYTSALEHLGVEVLVGPYYANHWKKWVKNNAVNIDYAFLNRPHIAVKYIDVIRKFTNAKIIYYGHDLHYLREYREYELTGKKEMLQSSNDWKQKELSLMQQADVVYYPSEVEVEEIKKLDSSIYARALPAYMYKPVTQSTYAGELRADLMFIGGFSHRPNVDAVKWFHDEIWPVVKSKNDKIKVYILGSNPPEDIKSLDSEDFMVKGFVTDEELMSYYENCRISVVPLRYGAGIKGKVVEAMHQQLPVITTLVGAEGIDESGESLCIANNAQEFAQKIVHLYDDYAQLQQYSRKALDVVNREFSIETAKQFLLVDFS